MSRTRVFAGIVVLAFSGFDTARAAEPAFPRRTVVGQILSSDRAPRVCIRVSPELHYIGRHAFTIGTIAAGDRFVFGEARDLVPKRLFIAQFEALLPGAAETYRYRTGDLELGGLSFKHGVFAFSNRVAAKESPTGEAALTAKFLEQHGFRLPDEWLADRYVTIGDSTRKSELILFVMEPLSVSGGRLSDLADPESPPAVIVDAMVRRSRAAFELVPCRSP